MIKMYCIFSRESVEKMKGNKGKMCAQAGHAYLHAWWDAEVRFGVPLSEIGKDAVYYPKYRLRNDLERIRNDNAKIRRNVMDEYRYGDDARKICLIAETDDDLRQLVEDYRGFTGTTLVEDCGYTVVEPGTITCAGIGPLRDEEKGDDLRSLELFLA
jgi:peptidyl-tRNA hydrolase